MKRKLPKITGASTTVGPAGLTLGVAWTPSPSDAQIAQRVITYLEDRRVLYDACEVEVPAHVALSIIDIRRFLTDVLLELPNELGLPGHLRMMRAACRKFLKDAGNEVLTSEGKHDVHRYSADSWRFCVALGELRGSFGQHLSVIATNCKLGIEGDLAIILPVDDSESPTD